MFVVLSRHQNDTMKRGSNSMRKLLGVGARRRGTALLVGAVMLSTGMWSPARADVLGPVETYPDIVPDVTQVYTYNPVVSFDPATGEVVYGPLVLAFDTWSQNLGTVALDLLSDEPTNLDNPTVSQCVSWVVEGVCGERRPVGGFEVHPAHGHIHFQEFARYELRKLREEDGRVNYSRGGLVAISDKVSFCLFDSRAVRPDARPVRTYAGCGSTREGISAGWADIYGSDLAGQQLPVDRLADGRYALVIAMDYADRLWESDNDNNVVEVIVELSNGATQATIVDKRWP